MDLRPGQIELMKSNEIKKEYSHAHDPQTRPRHGRHRWCTFSRERPRADARCRTDHKIPDKIMTPDSVESSIGTLRFRDGVPTVETTQKVYDHLDFLHGVETFLNFIPAASIEATRLSSIERGATKSNQAVIYDQLLDSATLMLTPNTDTVYLFGFLDLEADGPTVVEIPPGSGPGTVDDAFFRFVTDMGPPGPDRGQGGKYLIVPAWYKGEVPKDKKDG
jgi:hypothetical protein